MAYHPEYLINDSTDEEFVLVTDVIDTPEAALEYMRDLTGADYDEIEVLADPIWLAPGIPPGRREEDWYLPCEEDDPNGAPYWRTDV